MAAPLWQSGTLYFPGDIVQPVTAPPPNVPTISNGDFSAGAAGWDYTGGATYVLDGHGYGGNGSVRLPGNTPDGLALNQSKLYVDPGGTLTASCMIEQGASAVAATAGWVEVHWFAADDTPVQAPDKGNEINDGRGGAWHKSTVASVRPAAATYGRVGIHLTSVADHNHPIWGDALTVSGASAGLPQGLVYRAVQPASGTSAANEPAWPSILGQQVTDNDVIWEAVTTSRVTWTASPRYVSGATEPVWPTVMGGMVQDGTINWRAVSRRIEDEKCPNSKVVAIMASKVFAADRDIVRFSATANPLDWSTADDAGYLPTGLQQANANDTAVLSPYRGNLVAMNASTFQNWQVDPDPASMALLDQMESIGSVWQQAAMPVANDMFYLAALGVRTVGIANAAENLAAGDVGAPIDPLVRAAIALAEAGKPQPLATYYPSAGQYWLAFAGLDFHGPTVAGSAPDVQNNEPYSYGYVITAGDSPITGVNLRNSTLPGGWEINTSGVLTGPTRAPGKYSFTVRATDANGLFFDLPDEIEIFDSQIMPPQLTDWRYKQVLAADPTDYSAPGFNDSAWPVGTAPFGSWEPGYDADDIADGAPSGLIFAPQYDSRFNSQFATHWTNNTRLWMRRTLTLSAVPSGGVRVVAYIEDHCRFFINGALQFASPANHNGGIGQTYIIPAGQLIVGANAIAIECNDEAPASSASVVYADFILEVQ